MALTYISHRWQLQWERTFETTSFSGTHQPGRRDQRFYRHKYNAARTLEAFSATMRNEVDLNRLSEQLLAVVQETMQPTFLSLWLRKPEHEDTTI